MRGISGLAENRLASQVGLLNGVTSATRVDFVVVAFPMMVVLMEVTTLQMCIRIYSSFF
jgi:hypothetical protein